MIMRDGFSTTINLTAAGAPVGGVTFYEKQVKPPGIDAGGKIDTTGMRNNVWRTFYGKALKTLTDVTAMVAYDPLILNAIVLIAGKNALVAITYPDGEIIEFAGILDKFDPGENTEGNQPTATITIIPTNVLPDANFTELAPVLTAAP